MIERQTAIFTILVIIAAMMILPANAQTSDNIYVTGSIKIPSTNADNLTITDLTVYAKNEKTGFGGRASPSEDGSFKIKVPTNGTYSIYVFPNEIVMERGTGFVNTVQYPDGSARKYTVIVPDAGVQNISITYNNPGEYIAPTTTVSVPASTTTATAAPSPTAKPSPGFTVVALLIAFAAMALIVKRN